MTERVLVVAAHSDDEALGCGGALLLHAEKEHPISVIFFNGRNGGARRQSRTCAPKGGG